MVHPRARRRLSLLPPLPPLPLLSVLWSAACMPGTTAPEPAVNERMALRHAIDSMIALPETRHARWGILIVDPARGDTLYAHDAAKLFVPASNQKILTSAVALDLLGPDHQHRTAFLGGPIRDGVLRSDLLVVGGGDPSVSDHVAGDAMIPLQVVADALAARGIRRVHGSVRAHGNAFPDGNSGIGWPYDDFEEPYSAFIDELLFNEGFSVITVRGGDQAGDAAVASTTPASTVPRLRMTATTVARGGADSLPNIRAVKDSTTWEIVVSGTIAAGDSTTVAVTHPDPAAAYIRALREALVESGIAIDDSAARDSVAMTDTLFVLRSPPLAQILPFFMKPSQNQIGEMLFRSVAHAATDTGTVRVARRLYGERLTAWGAAPDGFAVFDGSGLSRRDLVSPETIIRVLDAMRRSPHFRAFYDAMPVAGVDGTLRSRMRGTPAEANVRAKTGTLGGVRSLSGYVTTAGGQLLLFSVLANNYLVGTDHISRVQDSIAVRLARLRADGRAFMGGGQR